MFCSWSNLKSSREKVPSSRFDLSMTGMCGAIFFSLTIQLSVSAEPAAHSFIPDDRRTSAHVSDAPLGCFLGWRFWLCRKLEHSCLLTLE
jgi:hypothetical protein